MDAKVSVSERGLECTQRAGEAHQYGCPIWFSGGRYRQQKYVDRRDMFCGSSCTLPCARAFVGLTMRVAECAIGYICAKARFCSCKSVSVGPRAMIARRTKLIKQPRKCPHEEASDGNFQHPVVGYDINHSCRGGRDRTYDLLGALLGQGADNGLVGVQIPEGDVVASKLWRRRTRRPRRGRRTRRPGPSGARGRESWFRAAMRRDARDSCAHLGNELIHIALVRGGVGEDHDDVALDLQPVNQRGLVRASLALHLVQGFYQCCDKPCADSVADDGVLVDAFLARQHKRAKDRTGVAQPRGRLFERGSSLLPLAVVFVLRSIPVPHSRLVCGRNSPVLLCGRSSFVWVCGSCSPVLLCESSKPVLFSGSCSPVLLCGSSSVIPLAVFVWLRSRPIQLAEFVWLRSSPVPRADLVWLRGKPVSVARFPSRRGQNEVSQMTSLVRGRMRGLWQPRWSQSVLVKSAVIIGQVSRQRL